METNELERRRWNDERWAELWPRRERLTDPVTDYVLDRLALRPGERVLDVGCGGGKSTLRAGLAVGPTGAVVGADVSAPLNAIARRRAAEARAGNVDFVLADVQTDRVEGGPFDAAMSQFGVMFFDEPVVAFGNIRAQLGPGGRLVFACWQACERNVWFFGTAIADLLPPPPEPPPGKSRTGPFALADPGRTTAILEEAGFVDVRHTLHGLEVEVPEDSVVDDDALVFLGLPGESFPAAQAAIDAHVATFRLPSGLLRLQLAFQLFEARTG